MKVRFKSFTTRALVPRKSTMGSACYDLFAAKCAVLEPGATGSVEMDIGFCFSEMYLAKIYPRSTMSLKSIFLGGGILDPDYKGNVRAILHNLSNNRIEINAGDRIAQVLFRKQKPLRFVEVSIFDNFTTEINNEGFGSTGI